MTIRQMLATLLMASALANASAQQMAQYEYWFDAKVDERVAAPCPADGTIDLQFDVSAMAEGLHRFTLRAQDDAGRWSSPMGYYFLRLKTRQEAATLATCEYWIDHEEADRTSTDLDGSGLLQLNLDVSRLADGIHTFTFRCGDDRGGWTAPLSTYFLKLPAATTSRLTRYEYWLDSRWSDRHEGQAADGLVSLDVDVAALTAGVHHFTFRVGDDHGYWSAPVTHYFLKPAADLAENHVDAYRYWFDDRPEDATFVAVEKPAAQFLLDVQLPTTGLSNEVTRQNLRVVDDEDGHQLMAVAHALKTQFRDSRSQWSAIQVDSFITMVGDRMMNLTPFLRNPEAEEYWDAWERQGDGSIQNNTAADGLGGHYFCLGNTGRQNWTASMRQTVSGLPAGTYTLTAVGRAAEGTTLTMSAAGYSVDFPAIGYAGGDVWEDADDDMPERQVNNGEGAGWNRRSVTFVTDGSPFDIEVLASAESYDCWADVDAFELTVNGVIERGTIMSLRNVQLMALNSPQAWNAVGQTVQLTVGGQYTNKRNRQGNIYYTVDGGSPQRVASDLAAGATFEKQIDCQFRSDVSPHVLSFYVEDTEGVVSERTVIEIENMTRTCQFSDIPREAIYTGEPITFDGWQVWDRRNGRYLDTEDYTFSYSDNVNDGTGRLTVEGRFPNYMGSISHDFVIRSMIDAADLALLRSFYEQTDGPTAWSAKWDLDREDGVRSDALYGVTAYNRHVTAVNLAGNRLKGQLPADLFRLPMIERINLASNELTGQVATEAIPATLRELRLDHNRLTSLSGPVPATVETLTLDAQDMTGADAVPLLLTSGMDGLTAALPNIVLYDHRARNFDADATLYLHNGQRSADATLVAIVRSNGQWTVQPTGWGNPVYRGQQGDRIACTDGRSDHWPVAFSFLEGDANLDGTADVLDLSTLLLESLDDYYRQLNFTAANLWTDTLINVQDMVCMVNRLLDADLTDASRSMRRMAPATTAGDAQLSCTDGALLLSSSVPVTAFDVMLSGVNAEEVESCLAPQGFAVSMRQQGDRLHVVGYAAAGQPLPAGPSTLLRIKSGTASVVAARLADDEAMPVSLASGVATQMSGLSRPSGDIAARIAEGFLSLTAASELTGVDWTLTAADGTIVARGHEDVLPAGTSRRPCGTLSAGVYLVCIHADGRSPMVIKLTVR